MNFEPRPAAPVKRTSAIAKTILENILYFQYDIIFEPERCSAQALIHQRSTVTPTDKVFQN